MTRLIEIPQTELHPTLRVLSDKGVTTSDAAWLRKSGNARLVARFIHAQQESLENPFEQTVKQLLATLRTQNMLGNWGIPEEVFDRLRETAPEWPKGHDSFLSFRIRFGEGQDGVELTFKAHIGALERVLGSYPDYTDISMDAEHFRLLGDASATHAPCVEWCVIDLSENVNKSPISVRDARSLADEGLVLAWLFPKRLHSDHEWFLAGYEVHDEDDESPWSTVLRFSFQHNADGKMEVMLTDEDDYYFAPTSSVPCLRQ